MSRSCTDYQIILHAIDQIFSDVLNNKPDSDPLSPFTTGRFTSGLKGWEKAATEGTCALCKTTYFCHSTEKTKEVHDEIERNDQFLWELSGACFDGWVRLALYTDRGGWIGTNPIFQKLSMTREEDDSNQFIPTSSDLYLFQQRINSRHWVVMQVPQHGA
ncbi:heterokaryon incompatibility protein [Fusarium sporotrichioides]|uniref:Heterokaryon incompatibility protein n=1 Tax=Fusarium sporotrichioides TaxID=5514 RepID=A0A395RFZ1_FUSSP|nr:heterokaryon incompatibility protein [Fusarium sporotrichioides]